jgi:NTP-dependent ternary system trypsin peptidase co-occuring protein
MTHYAEFPIDAGGTIVVEVDETSDWTSGDRPTTRGLGGGALIVQTETSFSQALARIQPAATELLASLRTAADPPDDVEVEFGVQMSADLGAFIAKASAEANFKVTLHWSTQRPARP